eukprot:1643890-Pyramimonas_sp.AAC.1
MSGLSEYWGGVFVRKEVGRAADLHCVNRFTPDVNWSDLPHPTELDIQRFLNKVPQSAPGPDQLPYAAWRFHPNGSHILYQALAWSLEGKALLF